MPRHAAGVCGSPRATSAPTAPPSPQGRRISTPQAISANTSERISGRAPHRERSSPTCCASVPPTESSPAVPRAPAPMRWYRTRPRRRRPAPNRPSARGPAADSTPDMRRCPRIHRRSSDPRCGSDRCRESSCIHATTCSPHTPPNRSDPMPVDQRKMRTQRNQPHQPPRRTRFRLLRRNRSELRDRTGRTNRRRTVGRCSASRSPPTGRHRTADPVTMVDAENRSCLHYSKPPVCDFIGGHPENPLNTGAWRICRGHGACTMEP